MPNNLESVDIRLSERMLGYDSEMWESSVRDFLKPENGELVLDIGAGYGKYLRYLIDRGAHVICFEPHPGSFARLRHRSLAYPEVLVHNMALGNSIGYVKLFLHSNPDLSSLTLRSSNFVRVRENTVDNLVRHELPTQTIDWIKIDVEGSEHLVLRGAVETLREQGPRLVIEIHGDENHVKVSELLRGLSYTTESIGEWAIWNDREMKLDRGCWIYASANK